MKRKKLTEKGFIATAVLYTLAALIMLIFMIIALNNKTTRKIQTDDSMSVKLKLSQYEIEYFPTTGEGEMAKTTCYLGKKCPLLENTFTKEGADFLGWSRNPDAEEAEFQDQEEVLNLAKPLEVCNLYAVWKWKEYNIEFAKENGVNNIPDPIIKTHGFDLYLPNNLPTKSNYVFKGWTLTQNGTKADYQRGNLFTLNEDTTLYPVWKVASQSQGAPNLYQTGCDIKHHHGSDSAPSRGKCSVSGNSASVNWSYCSSGGGYVYAKSYQSYDLTNFDYATIYFEPDFESVTFTLGGISKEVDNKSNHVTLNISNVTGSYPLSIKLLSSFNLPHTYSSLSSSIEITQIVLSN